MARTSTAQLVRSLQDLQLLDPPQFQKLQRLQGQFPELPALCQELVRRGWLTAWQAKQLAQGRSADVRLGSYLLLEPIGSGGNGQVFKARHDKMKRVAAVKVIRPELANDRETVQRFHREIEVIGKLDHPNIVHALEAGPIGSVLVLVTEFIDGIDLERLVCRSGPLPAYQACDYIRQAARGLAHAHQAGLIHRDIKPSNLIVSRAPPGNGGDTIRGGIGPGTVKIMDFGLARLQQPVPGSATSNLTVLGGAGVMQGTPDYMSPEQALDFHSADQRSDLYSLGCTFYYLLAGQPPFEAASLAEKLMKHQQAKPPPLPRTDLPPGLEPILARLLAKRSPDRYQTAAELAQALTDLLATLDTPSGFTSVDQLAAPASSPRRRRALVLVGGLALLALLGLGAYSFRGSGNATTGSNAVAIRPPADSTRTQEGPQPTQPARTGELVTNVAASTGKTYGKTTAQVGAVCYIDRGYKILELDRSLEGGVLIQTANNDMGVNNRAHLAFTLTAPAVVSVVADSKYTRLPGWLEDGSWQATPATVNFEGQGRLYKVYRKQFPAGRIILGGGGQPPANGAGGNYFVIIQPAS